MLVLFVYYNAFGTFHLACFCCHFRLAQDFVYQEHGERKLAGLENKIIFDCLYDAAASTPGSMELGYRA
jgi:hypothetical protein